MLTTLFEYSSSHISDTLDNSQFYKNYLFPVGESISEVLLDW
jgi:hypothetical protein